MKPAPLQLLDYWATSIHMDACPNYDPDLETDPDFDSIVVEHDVKQLESSDSDDGGSRWLVGLSIEQKSCDSANIPYTFSVTLQGIVLELFGLPIDEKLKRAITANGPAMLFGAAREMIRAATGRGPHRAVIIPSTNFIFPSQAQESTKAKSVKKKSRSQKPTKKTAKKAAKKKSS